MKKEAERLDKLEDKRRIKEIEEEIELINLSKHQKSIYKSSEKQSSVVERMALDAQRR